jgi:inositol-phosphate transport system permease protein
VVDVRLKLSTVLLYFTAIVLTLIIIVPLALLIGLAFSKSQVTIEGFTLDNFNFIRNGILFQENPVYSKLYPNVYTVTVNTMILALGNMLLVVLISSMAAYVISRYSFRGRSTLLGTFLVIHGVPASVLLIALYFLLRQLNLLNTLAGVILVRMSVDLPLGVWVLKGFYDSIPWDIEIASLVDGTSRLGAFYRVMLPLVTPGIFAVALFSFLSGWGEYIFVYTFIQSQTNWTLSLLIRSLVGEMGGINLALIAALSVFYLIPVIVLYVVGEKYLVRVTIGGVKG